MEESALGLNYLLKKEDNMKDIKPKETKPTAKEFAEKYSALCEETGFRVVVTPVFQARDDGTWSLVLTHAVGELPKLTKTK